jgi:hypothetical protein
MIFGILVCLMMFQIKHLVIDFYLQSIPQVQGKGIYGNLVGFSHSLDHAIGTMIICWLMAPFVTIPMMFLAAGIDLITHYHIDFFKMRFGNRDHMQAEFWHHLGLDQFAHQTVYLIIAAILFHSFI